MRFGNGAWTMLPGVIPTYLSRVIDARVGEREALLHVFSKLGQERWETLEGHMFTVRITSPAESVFRIQVTHNKGRRTRGPSYALHAEAREIGRIDDSPEHLSLTSGRLEVVVTKGPWAIEFRDSGTQERITSSPFKAMGLMEKEGHGLFMREQLTLRPGEIVYGLGERFQALTRNGQSIDMWN